MLNQTPYTYIAIEGNIGAGKSTLARMLSKDWQTQLILEEFDDNSFLPKFYADARRFAFPLEMSFLAARFNQLKNQLTEPELFNDKIISDYIFAKSLLFSKVNLDEDEYELYYKLFTIIQLQLPKPDLLVYLHTPIPKLLTQIAKRGRVYEQNIDAVYLEHIQQSYFDYLHQHADLKVLMLDCSNTDFEGRPQQYQQIKELLCRPYSAGIHTFQLLD